MKICGLTDEAGIRAAIDAGTDAVGFVFHERSPRNISVELATVSGARVSIRFYPDGASSGAVLRLIGTGGERLIAVDPLTSRIDLTHD